MSGHFCFARADRTDWVRSSALAADIELNACRRCRRRPTKVRADRTLPRKLTSGSDPQVGTSVTLPRVLRGCRRIAVGCVGSWFALRLPDCAQFGPHDVRDRPRLDTFADSGQRLFRLEESELITFAPAPTRVWCWCVRSIAQTKSDPSRKGVCHGCGVDTRDTLAAGTVSRSPLSPRRPQLISRRCRRHRRARYARR